MLGEARPEVVQSLLGSEILPVHFVRVCRVLCGKPNLYPTSVGTGIRSLDRTTIPKSKGQGDNVPKVDGVVLVL